MAVALSVALASAGCSTSRFTYQAGSSAAGGAVTGYNATGFSASGSRGSIAIGSPVPGGSPPASGLSAGSVAGPGGTTSGVSLAASNGAAVAILLGVGVVNLIANSFAPGRPVVTRQAGGLSPEVGHLMREDPYTFPAPPDTGTVAVPSAAARPGGGNAAGNTRIVPRQTMDGTITGAQLAGPGAGAPSAVPGPGPRASVQDCTRPVDLSGGNLYCR